MKTSVKEMFSPFTTSSLAKKTVNWIKNDPVRNRLAATMFKPKSADKVLQTSAKMIRNHNSVIRKIGRPILSKGLGAGLVLGAVAMFGVGMMKGAMNASTQIVAQRQMQDQRFARNITMMSRLGYTSGTSSMNKYSHTTGLSQALSRNRHGRGGY
jgi:hypothetical protein